MFWQIQEICSKMGTRIFKIEGELFEIINNWILSWQPPNFINQKICQIEPTLKSDLFLGKKGFSSYISLCGPRIPKWIFSHLEWYGPKKPTTPWKPLRIAYLQPPASGQDKLDTLYVICRWIENFECRLIHNF